MRRNRATGPRREEKSRSAYRYAPRSAGRPGPLARRYGHRGAGCPVRTRPADDPSQHRQLVQRCVSASWGPSCPRGLSLRHMQNTAGVSAILRRSTRHARIIARRLQSTLSMTKRIWTRRFRVQCWSCGVPTAWLEENMTFSLFGRIGLHAYLARPCRAGTGSPKSCLISISRDQEFPSGLSRDCAMSGCGTSLHSLRCESLVAIGATADKGPRWG